MRINHNISAMITQNSLFAVGQSMQKSLQKLSTGLRINSAADDAAGLGVSENLRNQVTGMQQALKNTQDAIAMLNIADGALNEQANILQRMRELIIQAKNDSYSSVERSYMYQEFSADMHELDRIANVTNYNKMQLFAAPPNDPAADGDELYAAGTSGNPPNQQRYGRDVFDTPADGIFGANEYSSSNHFNMMVGQNYTAQDAAAYNQAVINGASQNSFDKSASNLITIQFGQMDTNGLLSPAPGTQDIYNMVTDFNWDPNNSLPDLTLQTDWDIHGYAAGEDTVQKKLDFILTLIDGEQISPTLDADIYTGVNNTTGLKRVNEMRAYIGAMTNRLEHNVNNLMNQANNTQAAESVIRDVDFAKETATFTKNQILTQSATAMLAQANSVTQNVLQLLK
jgi:flagellin